MTKINQLLFLYFKVISSCRIWLVYLLVTWISWKKNFRSVIPPCAVKKMRVTFLAEDGNYTGYKDDDTGDDDDNALTAS